MMKKFTLAFVAALSLSVFGLTGCGGSGENTVIENTTSSELPPDQQAQYEEQMRSGQGNSQAPGN